MAPHEEGKNCPMPFMKFPQYENGHYVHYFSIDKINEIYGQSRCGLILSAEEGACFAAMEYLLCGLPVVTTPNIGGRDEFFDKRLMPSGRSLRRKLWQKLWKRPSLCRFPPKKYADVRWKKSESTEKSICRF